MRYSICGLLVLWASSAMFAHQGPDPVAHWVMHEDALQGDQLSARLGPSGTVSGEVTAVVDEAGESLRFRGKSSGVTVASIDAATDYLPQQNITVAAWVAVDRPLEWGGIVGAIQDNGQAETGWILGYNREHFYFAIASEGADDGDGRLTYLHGEIPYVPGKLYHVVGTYDGKRMQLYVNGQREAESEEQTGPILYPTEGELVLAAYRDRNENFPHQGRIREISIYDEAATDKWVKRTFEATKKIAELPPQLGQRTGELAFEIDPYLQYVTQDGITIMWKSTSPAVSYVRYGESVDLDQRMEGPSQPTDVHEIRLTGLEPNTQYFYEAVSESDRGGISSETFTFQTACGPDTPFAFAIISDTQDNPPVASQIAKLAWSQRPSFVLHPGDLVGVGRQDSDWSAEFFPSMRPLISRVCLFPVLGNHEQDAKFYYDYMSLPAPEYYYSFRYGNAEFFMVDSNRNLQPGSEQYEWLEKQLAASHAQWKFVTHHHPPYSSDENDYGDLWSTNQSTRGDLRVRKTCELYDKYGVDVVWNGHIHSYERTWPLAGEKPVEKDGTVYMITGGGGGGLETPGPFRTFFQNNVKRGHHFCMAYVNGGVLEVKAFDLEGRLFDHFKLVR